MAPERISGQLESNHDIAKKADIWSAGILLYFLICGKVPFEGKSNEELLGKISNSEFLFNGKEWDNLLDAKNLVY